MLFLFVVDNLALVDFILLETVCVNLGQVCHMQRATCDACLVCWNEQGCSDTVQAEDRVKQEKLITFAT
jgi:hypothetical protein